MQNIEKAQLDLFIWTKA